MPAQPDIPRRRTPLRVDESRSEHRPTIHSVNLVTVEESKRLRVSGLGIDLW